MPRVSNTSDDAPKKAVRKRAPRRTVASKAAAAPRVSAPLVERQNTVARKAPTSLPKTGEKRSLKKIGFLVGFVVLVFGIAAGIGFSDSGQLNVTSIVNEKNQEVANQQNDNRGESESIVVPVQNTAPVPVASMRGRGVGSTNVPAAEVTSSSTEEVASSTEAVDEGDSAEVAGETEEESNEIVEEAETEEIITEEIPPPENPSE